MPAQRAAGNRSEYYYQSLISVLEPDLGRAMAVTTVQQYCSRLGITEGALCDEHLELLAGLLQEGLATFVGRPRLQALLVQIRKIKEYDDWGIL